MLTALALVLGGIIAGGAGLAGIQALGGKGANKHDAAIAEADADTVIAVAESAPATVTATASVVTESLAEHTTDADTRQAIATADGPTLAVLAAVEPDASATTIALAGYLGCVAGSQGKGEGSSAYGCQERGKVLDEAVRAQVAAGVEERKAAAEAAERAKGAVQP